MGKLGSQILQEKNKSNRRWKNFEKTSLNTSNRKAKKIFKKIKKIGLSTRDLYSLLSGSNNFLGVFSADQIPLIIDSTRPIFLIVNIDNSQLPGSHWIAFRLSLSSLEVFDSLGFCPKRWRKFPKSILNFLLRYNQSHKIFGTPRLQEKNSYTCGVYCIYFVLFRQLHSFNQCINIFSTDYSENDFLVLEKINKLK